MTHSDTRKGESEEPEHRLHPMTLLLRAIVSIPALIILLLPVVRSPDSTALFNLVLSILYAALVLPWLVLHYLRFRYRITPNEVIIHSGVLTRRRRNIPVDRIQNVEIEQPILQRMTGTARVRIYTAGSPQAEGALDVVSLQEAHRIREMVRAFQQRDPSVMRPSGRGHDEGREAVTKGRVDGDLDAESAGADDLHVMTPQRVLLSGAYRFSLLYIAIIFTFLQYVEPDPQVLVSWITRGRLAGVVEAAMASPWTAAIVGVLSAMFIGWLSGIVVNFNKYYGFRLSLEGDKLYRRHGLLSVREGTIPLRRIQTLIIRTNPVMRRFGWYALEVQTMGIDVREQGHSVAIPFAKEDEVLAIARRIREGMPNTRGERWRLPDVLEPVSKITIRRALVRYTLALAAVASLIVWLTDLNGWYLMGIWPVAAIGAVLRWKYMGYALREGHLVVRRGVLRQYTWIIPVGRTQVVYTQASLFQRRLHLKTVYVDTAGASPVLGADIIDVERGVADSLADEIYRQFQERAA